MLQADARLLVYVIARTDTVGPLSPAASNLTEDGRAKNRRVELKNSAGGRSIRPPAVRE